MIKSIDTLKKYYPLDLHDDLGEFLEALGRVSSDKDVECIPFLLSCFDDNSDYFDVLQMIMTNLEDMPMEEYFKILIPSIPRMITRSPEWTVTIVQRILLNPDSRQVFMKLLHLCPKQDLENLLTRIEDDWDEMIPICASVRSSLVP